MTQTSSIDNLYKSRFSRSKVIPFSEHGHAHGHGLEDQIRSRKTTIIEGFLLLEGDGAL